MKRGFLTYICFLLLSVSINAREKEKFNLIIDTDMALDDWGALLYVFNQKEKVNLLGITLSVNGESHCLPGKRNLLDLIHLSGRSNENIPIACGDTVPMEGFNTYPDAWRESVDTLYGLSLPKSPQPFPKDIHAVDLLKTLLEESSKNVVILTLGSLTNIAQLIEKYPTVKSKIKRIFVMGGAINVGGNLIVKGFTEGLKNKYAEWNIWIDPLASQKVFRSGIPITLIPLDATNGAKFSASTLEAIKKESTSKSANFYRELMEKNSWLIDSGEYYFWDPFAASAIFSEVCETTPLNLDIVVKFDPKISGTEQLNEYSRSFAKGADLQFKSFLKDRKALDSLEAGRVVLSQGPSSSKVDACIKDIKADLFLKDFITTLNRF